MYRRWLWHLLCVALVASLYLSACGSPGDVVMELTTDQDGDGFSDAEEEEMGTDPTSQDTDGDGFLDGAEVQSFTDPTDATDHPYEGGWPIDSCRHTIESTGNATGQITPNFELMNQDGETVRLHDFCGKAVLLVGAAFW